MENVKERYGQGTGFWAFSEEGEARPGSIAVRSVPVTAGILSAIAFQVLPGARERAGLTVGWNRGADRA